MIDQGPQPLASWYADPKMPSRLRYWDGRVWTEHVAYAPDPGHPANKDAGGRGDPGDAPGWQDLAANRPGSAARHKALELRQAAPIKTFVARVLNVHTDERGWRIGADGEEKVAMRLQRLGEGWYVLHAVPVGEKDSDIDHVVIGPPGVFTLNTKNHSRARVWIAERSFLVNGRKTDYLSKSRFEAERASKLLSASCRFPITAEPVIVVMAAALTIKAQPRDVHVVARKQITNWLSSRPPVLDPKTVDTIHEQARRDSTWRTATRLAE